jgi:hypothetical protein
VPPLFLALAVLMSVLGLPTEAGAATPPAPKARLQVIVKQVLIHDDNEGILSGDGEMALYTGIWRCKPGNPPPCRAEQGQGHAEGLQSFETSTRWSIARGARLVNAGTGDTVTLDQQVPGAGDLLWWENTSPELGFAIYDAEQYVVHFDMEEWDDENCDFSCDDPMGYVEHTLDNRDLGLGIGTHTARSVQDDGKAGDYTITYEIRPIPLADLEPIAIRVRDEPGTDVKHVCMTVSNRGPLHAGAFKVRLRVDGKAAPDGIYPVSVLTSGTSYLACVHTTLPASGQHTLSMTIDEERAIREYDETNNFLEIPYTGIQSKPATPGQPVADADLTVGAIKVNGQAPDGKYDCKAGKNAVAVTLKINGTSVSGLFTTRLTVDGVDVAEQSAVGLEPGPEHEVRFENIEIKKGEHKLTALVDANREIAETDEDNNVLTVTARC